MLDATETHMRAHTHTKCKSCVPQTLCGAVCSLVALRIMSWQPPTPTVNLSDVHVSQCLHIVLKINLGTSGGEKQRAFLSLSCPEPISSGKKSSVLLRCLAKLGQSQGKKGPHDGAPAGR